MTQGGGGKKTPASRGEMFEMFHEGCCGRGGGPCLRGKKRREKCRTPLKNFLANCRKERCRVGMEMWLRGGKKKGKKIN